MSSYFWLLIILVLSMIEVATCGLTTVWFVISAVLALFLSFLIESDVVLFSVFVIVGTMLLLTTRPVVKKYMVKNKVPTNVDKIIGLIAVVTEEIIDNEVGEVKVEGKRWSAISKENIKVNEKVVVKAITGVKLKVEREKK